MTLDPNHWRGMRAIFGNPDLGLPKSESSEADEAYARGIGLLKVGDVDAAETALKRADQLGHAGAPRELANWAMSRGDTALWYALLDRACDRGDGRAMSLLGHFMRPDKPDQAIEQLRRADESGDCEGSRELGLALMDRGDLSGAEEAFRRSDARGSASGSLALGLFLRDERNDLPGAEAALLRADRRGHPKGALNLIDLYIASDDSVAADREKERALELAARYPTLFDEMQGEDFARYVHGKGRAAAVGASGSGCLLTVLSAAVVAGVAASFL